MSQSTSQKVAHYISKGFDEQTARYFAAGRRHLVSAQANDDFTLTLLFSPAERRIFDMKPLLKKGGVFTFLQDLENFRRVYIDENGCPAWDVDPAVDSTTHWDNKVDISSDTCYMQSTPLDP